MFNILNLINMKTKSKLIALSLVSLSLASSPAFAATTPVCSTWTWCATPTTLNVTINPGQLCIASENTLSFGSLNMSTSQQTATQTFGWSWFYVDDLKWADNWYYTTVQMSWTLSNGNQTIPSANIAMKTSAVWNAGITTQAWTPNTRVVINSLMASFQSLDTARRLIERPTWANYWVVGRYWVLPTMQLTIPAYQAVGTYTWTLVYTLIEN